MYSLKQLVISGCKRRWILMDLETSLPLLYPLRYHIDHLAFRSLSTQSASLQSVKFFYEFWRQKYGVSFCYSFPLRISSVSINAFLGQIDSFCFQALLVGFKLTMCRSLTVCLRGLQTQAVQSKQVNELDQYPYRCGTAHHLLKLVQIRPNIITG